MAQEILDTALEKQLYKKVRFPFLVMVEYVILSTNVLVMLIGIVVGCIGAAFITENWVALILPPIFILLLGLPNIFFVRNWQKKTLEYEAKKDIRILAVDSPPNYKNIVAQTIFGFFANIGFLYQFMEISSATVNNFDAIFSENLIFNWILLFPMLILGPMQSIFWFWAVRTTKKAKALLAQHPEVFPQKK